MNQFVPVTQINPSSSQFTDLFQYYCMDYHRNCQCSLSPIFINCVSSLIITDVIKCSTLVHHPHHSVTSVYDLSVVPPTTDPAYPMNPMPQQAGYGPAAGQGYPANGPQQGYPPAGMPAQPMPFTGYTLLPYCRPLLAMTQCFLPRIRVCFMFFELFLWKYITACMLSFLCS